MPAFKQLKTRMPAFRLLKTRSQNDTAKNVCLALSFYAAGGGSTVVKLSTHDAKFQGSKTASTCNRKYKKSDRAYF
jgi:hypothetical protein